MRKGDTFTPPDIVPGPEQCEIVDYDMRMVPYSIMAHYRMTFRTFWVDVETWAEASNRLALIVERILMPCSEAIIMELRAMRGGDVITPEVLDPASSPFNLPLATLNGVNASLTWAGRGAGQNTFDTQAYLLQILELLQAEAADDELKGLVQQIALLLAA